MRRNDREINSFEEIVKVIEQCEVCHLAFFDEEYPYILPMKFGLKLEQEQITLYFHGALEGKKYELMAKNNKVGFEMDCSHRLVINEETSTCTMEYESVIGTGILTMVENADKLEALKILMKQYHREGFEINEKVIPFTNVFQLAVTSFTGKKRML